MTPTLPASKPIPANKTALHKLLFIGKIFFVGFLILLMNLPMGMIRSVIDERNQYRDSADWDVIRTWGREQTLGGPVLTVPYLTYQEITETDSKGREHKRIVPTRHLAQFLPENLRIDGNILPEVRYRGIYRVLLYKTDLQISGNFLKPDFSSLRIPETDVLWNEAVISLGVPDMRAIQQAQGIEVAGVTLPFGPGTADSGVFESGMEARLKGAVETPRDLAFKMDLKVAGSRSLQFLPFGKQTEVTLHSPWQDPSFVGDYLPDRRDIGEKGFTAHWSVLHLGRNYPQTWSDQEVARDRFQSSAFGVDLKFPVEHYQMATRSAKYGILFILLTFVTFFFFEIFNRFKIHPVQYLLVGFGLCLFYLLLLSLSEHVGFARAYLAATVATVGLITGYSLAVLKTGKRALAMGGILGGLYAYLYILLQLQDFALVMGSVGLFLILALIMFVTRKVDWYSLGGAVKSPVLDAPPVA